MSTWDRYEDQNTARSNRLDQIIQKKQKNFDKWLKESKTEERDRRDMALANKEVFEKRKSLIHQKIYETDERAIESYK